jgi:DNA-binding response OmpR family regulator
MMAGSAKHQVLVLEDSILVAMAIEAALEDRGFEAIVVGSLAAAEERLKGGVPLAALLDLQLPDGNSLALARSLDARGCPVARCSGADSGVVPDGHGFARRFRKPIAAEALAAWVADIAGRDGFEPAIETPE